MPYNTPGGAFDVTVTMVYLYNNQLDSLRRYLKELIEGLDFVEWGSEFQRWQAEGTKE